jgi:hypothetical protein
VLELTKGITVLSCIFIAQKQQNGSHLKCQNGDHIFVNCTFDHRRTLKTVIQNGNVDINVKALI